MRIFVSRKLNWSVRGFLTYLASRRRNSTLKTENTPQLRFFVPFLMKIYAEISEILNERRVDGRPTPYTPKLKDDHTGFPKPTINST